MTTITVLINGAARTIEKHGATIVHREDTALWVEINNNPEIDHLIFAAEETSDDEIIWTTRTEHSDESGMSYISENADQEPEFKTALTRFLQEYDHQNN